LLDTASKETTYPPTIIYTGATAGIKASANFVSFASAKFGLRALSQSLAKEFGPKGVHVSHVVADGVFDSDRGREYMGSSEGLMDTVEMAEAYWKLHTQGKRAWTWELDLRPYLVIHQNINLTGVGEMVIVDIRRLGRERGALCLSFGKLSQR
jgi:NAD(P)-dependent dehydrogenase (short-subunit alcohol dehydrogenase family)